MDGTTNSNTAMISPAIDLIKGFRRGPRRMWRPESPENRSGWKAVVAGARHWLEIGGAEQRPIYGPSLAQLLPAQSERGRNLLDSPAKHGYTRDQRSPSPMLLRCALVLAAFVATLCSQAVTATLLGTVTDPSAAVVTDAQVTITESQTGVRRQLATNAEGIYTQPYIPPGIYSIEVEKPGFKKATRGNI
jgi:hypothetical protein